MAGVQQPFDAAGPLKQARDAMREFGQEVDQVVGKLDRLQGERTVKVAMVGDTGGGILPPGQARWSEAPDPNRYRRMILPGDTAAENLAGGATSDIMGQRALEYWQKLGAGGATHALRHAGDFALKGWDSFLPTREKEEHGEMLRLAASRPGQEFASAMEGMEKAGQKIAAFLAEIAKGGDAADKAKEPLAAAREELEGMSGKGSRALSAMPGGRTKEALAAEAARLHQDAAAGVRMTPKAPQNEVAGFTGNQLLQMATSGDMQGAIRTVAAEGLQKLIGLGGGAAAALGATASAAGGIYAGWKWTEDRSDRRLDDAMKAGGDAAMSARLGFDVRGVFWNDARNAVRRDVNMVDGIQALAGINAGGASLREQDYGGKEGLMSMSQYIARYGPMLGGLSSGEVGQLAGTAIRSGAVSRDPSNSENVYSFLKRISHAVEKGSDAGISSRETLGAIAELNARQVEALGHLSPETNRWNQAALGLLTASGDPSLQGKEGAKTLAGIGGQKNEQQLSMLLRAAGTVDPDIVNTLVGSSARNKKEREALLGMSMLDKIQMIQEDPHLMERLYLTADQSGSFDGMPLVLKRRLTGGNIGIRRMAALKGAGITEEKIAAEEGAADRSDRLEVGKLGGDVAREMNESFVAVIAKGYENLERTSGIMLRTAEEMKATAADLRSAAYQSGLAFGGDERFRNRSGPARPALPPSQRPTPGGGGVAPGAPAGETPRERIIREAARNRN